ncbi:hypothetical protein [Apilactobacillus xinyiensis]|uniref:hypothetical protein n=1 Tax=Apilactobacillus xinyiensis TaxID=2841032 RepID=UPI0020102215|nr:hypothetical protein [Apilactobacillus xinyiensis]MCL0330777.1 hypothetical protein [Apilactobacillus xinyiensis]
MKWKLIFQIIFFTCVGIKFYFKYRNSIKKDDSKNIVNGFTIDLDGYRLNLNRMLNFCCNYKYLGDSTDLLINGNYLNLYSLVNDDYDLDDLDKEDAKRRHDVLEEEYDQYLINMSKRNNQLAQRDYLQNQMNLNSESANFNSQKHISDLSVPNNVNYYGGLDSQNYLNRDDLDTDDLDDDDLDDDWEREYDKREHEALEEEYDQYIIDSDKEYHDYNNDEDY